MDSDATIMIRRYFVPCTLGIEKALVRELHALNLDEVEEARGGATFLGDRRAGYRACIQLRSAIRVQEELARARVGSEHDLYRFIQSGDWSRYLSPRHTLAVHASLRDAPLSHSGYAAQKVKDAIVDWFRDRTGTRPNVDRDQPQVPLRLVMQHDLAILYRDLASESLHKRGYREAQVKSPLNEATAAGILLLAGYDGQSPILDPMCGSGTFLIEAAHMALHRAPGLGRHFPFETWPDFDASEYERVIAEARALAKHDLPFTFEGADRHRGAIGLAAKCGKAAGVASLIRFTHSEIREFRPERPPTLVFTNPPYGMRLDEDGDPESAWNDLGQFLKAECSGAKAYVLCGESGLSKHLRLKASQRFPVHNGPIECRLLKYEILPKRVQAKEDPVQELPTEPTTLSSSEGSLPTPENADPSSLAHPGNPEAAPLNCEEKNHGQADDQG